MKYLLIFVAILSFTVSPNAMVQVTNSITVINSSPVQERKSNAMVSWFKKAQKWVEKKLDFTFDLSDPVDGWLSLAILAFALCLGLGLVSWLFEGLYLLNILSGVALITAVVSFWIWVYKAYF